MWTANFTCSDPRTSARNCCTSLPPDAANCSFVESKRFRFWWQTDEMIKTSGHDENITFWWNLTKLEFAVLTNKKWHFWQQNPLEPTYHNKQTISDGKKLAKLKSVAEILTKFAILDKRKEKWMPKALKLFWQDFIELANNSYSHALLKALFSDDKYYNNKLPLHRQIWTETVCTILSDRM